MTRTRRAAAALALPLVAASLTVAPCAAARAGTHTGTHGRTDPIGGAQLASRGVVLNPAAGVPGAPKINAASWVIADMDTGDVLAAKDPHGQYLPASTLKTLTALTLVPKLDANRLIRPSQHACDVEGTKVGMTHSMQYKVSDLFYALMMMSANDSAVTLAEANGGMKKTIADMNTEARRIHAGDTLAASPNGLDVDYGLNVHTQHTSSYDLALILREGLKNTDYRRYVETIDHHFPAPLTKAERKKHKKTGGYPIHTHNRMLPGQPSAYRGMIGGKNGYTIAAEQTFVAAARRDGHTILISLMKADIPPSKYATQLLNWGFQARGKVKPVGSLVSPGDDDQPKKTNTHSNTLLPPNPLTGDDSGANWGLLAGGTAGAVLAVGVLFWMIRRRRGGGGDRPGTPATSSANGAPGSFGSDDSYGSSAPYRSPDSTGPIDPSGHLPSPRLDEHPSYDDQRHER
ncbi:D-alanyl-D-alanine carboxypeptidase [Actinomadura barringtoniae]|uniref:D-alanyl-D-alanine carboxypeptidase n=1 Tax=Actinomadura barringtoniae TaxID=1427535 RepID=A0A939T435_9ACTN|nr:LPXTG cell wall anchor domain-containing protein [Actinomadura barringtoniae]MBO2452091.1 D-alanyl-D-alanine carboxypeptidase [Actinomadura barringtoniae]